VLMWSPTTHSLSNAIRSLYGPLTTTAFYESLRGGITQLKSTINALARVLAM
jgi:hypothetical protein